MDKLGIYIHIPFCIKKCNYCDFCSFTKSTAEQRKEYTNELCRRIYAFCAEHGKREVDTVYFGGGTPTLLEIENFQKIFSALNKCFSIDGDAEITVECNPASIGFSGLYDLRNLGVNRLSIGLQSANEEELVELGRLHDFEGFCKTFMSARDAGFDNISVDIMYGIPNQTKESFEKTLREVLRLSPEHISAYGLKLEEGTPFSEKRDILDLPDEDCEYEMYLLCNNILREHDYERYEISNFSKHGYRSRHNLRYWRLSDYIGFGVSAHSCFEGVRTANSRDIDAFCRGEDIRCESRVISEREKNEEYVMLALRLEEGIDCEEYERMSGKQLPEEKTQTFIKNGFLQRKGDRIAFTSKGFFVSNALLCEMLDIDAFE